MLGKAASLGKPRCPQPPSSGQAYLARNPQSENWCAIAGGALGQIWRYYIDR